MQSKTVTGVKIIATVGIGVIFSIASLAIGVTLDQEAAKTAAATKPLMVGAKAPNTMVKDASGKSMKLKDVIGKKPTVVVFYRGGWCPFCNRHLAGLGQIEEKVKANGYQIIGITPDSPEELQKTVGKIKLPYTLYSDSSAKAMMDFGVAFRVDDETFTTYRDKYKLDLEKASGATHHILPVPSVFIIKKGKITFAHSNPDYKVRLSSEELLKAVSM